MGHSYQRGRILFRQARYKLAVQEFRDEIAESPGSTNAHAMLGMTFVNLKDRAAAAAEIHEAVRLGPDDSYCHFALAHLALMPGKRGFFQAFRDERGLYRQRLLESKTHVGEAIRLNPRILFHWQHLAWIECQLLQWRKALQAAERGLELQPTDQRCLQMRANALLSLGRQMEAGKTLDDAIAHDPENAATHLRRGWFMLGKGEYLQALEHFTQSIRLDPTQDRTRAALTQARLARFALYRWPLRVLLWNLGGREPAPRAITQTILIGYFVFSFILLVPCWGWMVDWQNPQTGFGMQLFMVIWAGVGGMAIREWWRSRHSR